MFGKILGAMIGFTIGLAAHSIVAGLVLAAVGTIIGHRVDLGSRAPEEKLPPPVDDGTPRDRAKETAPTIAPPPDRSKFVKALCQLFVALARVDGDVVQPEVRAVREFFERDLGWLPGELEPVRVALKDAIAHPRPIEAVARACASELMPSEKLLLVNALYECALADGPLKKVERDAINRAVERLGVSDEDHRTIIALHFGDGHEHYAVLGIDAAASDDAVKSAFRRLAASHHPDKVAHLGPKATQVAERRFREIKDAYDEIRRLRGL